jgi:hypothetical protein
VSGAWSVRRLLALALLAAGLALLVPTAAPALVTASAVEAVTELSDAAPSTSAPAPSRAWSPATAAALLPAAAAEEALAGPAPTLALHLLSRPAARPPTAAAPSADVEVVRERGPPVRRSP